ncbi:arrestin domain-containing [Fusarium albosuccineum]|uniref:ATP-dependent DNA helicase n=1 Tax=Fusarium albosuccineum TaxID=1237068 RepID=A0A8H4LJ54_9HYPO|nr:arrestin domain-containing [Fusarium albosuccineum]
MDSSLPALLERLRGRTPGSTLSSLGLKMYNDISGAGNSNTNATPGESRSTVEPSISDHVPNVRPVGLASRRSHPTVQPSTLGGILESIDPASEASQSAGQSSKPGNNQQQQPSVNEIDNANAQTQVPGNRMSRLHPGSTTPIQTLPRSRGKPRSSRASRRKDARERNWRQRRQAQQQRPLVAAGPPPASLQLPSNVPRHQERRAQQAQQLKPVPVQQLTAANPACAADITNVSQHHLHDAMGMRQSMSLLSSSDVDQHGNPRRGGSQHKEEQNNEQESHSETLPTPTEVVETTSTGRFPPEDELDRRGCMGRLSFQGDQQEFGPKRKADEHGPEQTNRRNRRRVENSNFRGQTEALERAIGRLEDEFTEKERISFTGDWCKPVPRERNISTVMDFYQAFHNTDTLPIHTCMICYRKISAMELKELSWEEWTNSAVMNSCRTHSCPDCFPVGKAVPSCEDCAMNICEGNMARGGNLHQALGCEHMYPDALRDLTLVEEKLIALNTHFGFVARIKVTKSTKQSTAYARHVKGHITVFPNNVQDLVTTVLPHPLLQSLEDIHISWHGPQRPAPSDLSKLLSVRRGAVERALVWLKEFNPHYRHIQIDEAELDSWGEPGHGVPSGIYDRMERDEPSAWEETRTAPIVPAAERGMDDTGPQSLEQIVDGLGRAYDENDVSYDEDQQLYDERSREELEYEGMGSFLDEMLASGMFPLDTAPRATDADKLQFAIDTIRGGHTNAQVQQPNQSTSSAQDLPLQPYIHISRGNEFADMNDLWHLAKAFPTLFPFGFGGPRCKEEMESDLWKNSVQLTGHVHDRFSTREGGEDATSPGRNLGLHAWMKKVLQRHGGRFANHPAFSFLVFNIEVRSRNRGVSMVSVRRKDFAEVERIIQSLTPERLAEVQRELEAGGSTRDEDIKKLLRYLSYFGYKQAMSQESRLAMRRKIKALIIRYGIPAIWFTLNPNDITNPVKLHLAAYRKEDKAAAEATLLRALQDSSAIFFHREVEMFFEHYVKVGEESVFGRIEQYFGAVETNERGALHVHGLLWLEGNLELGNFIGSHRNGEDDESAAMERERILKYVDSVFTEDLNETAAFSEESETRVVYDNISHLMVDTGRFSEQFDDEAHFCAGRVQMHVHTATCVKYSHNKEGGKGPTCRFRAPWKLFTKSEFGSDGILRLQRSHPMINRWNKPMAVGLRHNHDISFIGTQSKTMALIYYLTNYATKIQDPIWKRVAVAAELLPSISTTSAVGLGATAANYEAKANINRQYLMRIANRIFTERPLSQVEVIAHFLDYPSEFSSTKQWSYVNMTMIYWAIHRRWQYLQKCSSTLGDDDDRPIETRGGNGNGDDVEASPERVLVGSNGKKLPYIEAYDHRGEVLQTLCFYDYVSLVKLQKRIDSSSGELVRIEFERNWKPGRDWVQVLRSPGKYAVPCINGFLDMDFDIDANGDTYRRAAVQHLALFVPWEKFTTAVSGDINEIWGYYRRRLPKRLQTIASNIQLLKRSAEDARRDAKQWAVAGDDAVLDDIDAMGYDVGDSMGPTKTYRSDQVGQLGRLMETVRGATAPNQVTAGSESLVKLLDQLRETVADITDFADGLETIAPAESPDQCQPSLVARSELPMQHQLRGIKSKQGKAGKEIVQRIQGSGGVQGPQNTAAGREALLSHTFAGAGEDSMEISETDTGDTYGPSTRVAFGPSTTFLHAGRQIASRLTLNERQEIAFLLVCRHLDTIPDDDDSDDFDSSNAENNKNAQLCEFLGGEGGTGKSRVIEALAELFASKAISHRLLMTATSGAAAARINGVTIHSACGMQPNAPDGNADDSSTVTYVDGDARRRWRKKWLLIIDEVSMLGLQTLSNINRRLCASRGSSQDFGGIPVVLLSGDFHQFRPVQNKSLLTPWSALRIADEMRAHALWTRFTTVVMLTEQVRAAGDPELQRLLTRIRQGQQDESDMELLNSRCFQEGRAIPWGKGITVVTPLNSTRWCLNMDAVLAFQRHHQKPLRIFLPQHRWGKPSTSAVTEEEATLMASVGDDSKICVPATFMFLPGMPVVVTKNTNPGLKLVNGAKYQAMEVIPDTKSFPGYQLAPNIILHFGPPAGLILLSESTKKFKFDDMPPGTVLLTPTSAQIPIEKKRGKKRPWQRHEVSRRGLPCTAAFACTDYKIQGETLLEIALELRGTGTKLNATTGQLEPGKCDPYSLHGCGT